MIPATLHGQLEKLIESKGLQLYGVEFLKEDKTKILRVYLYKKEGVTLQDCEVISNLIAPLLDVELQDIDSYHLEVSSPGVERVLKESKHFLCSIGENIEIRLYNKQIIRGILKGYYPDNIHECNENRQSYIEIASLDSYPTKSQAIRASKNPHKQDKTSMSSLDSYPKSESNPQLDSLSEANSCVTQKIALKECKKIKTIFLWDNCNESHSI